MKPIDKLDFWKKRIDDSKRSREHYSVYVVDENKWKYINDTHREILSRECKGKVLDAGCGYGRWSELFEDYVGVDFSPDFIAEAQRKYPNKTFVQADLKALPFADKEFDTAFCVSIKKMIIDNLGQAEWDSMQEELKRVAKRVVLCEYEQPKPYEVI